MTTFAKPSATALSVARSFRCRVRLGEGMEPGKVCSVCDVIISSTEIEFEVTGPTILWAHLVCYDIWRYESGTIQQLARTSAELERSGLHGPVRQER